MQSYYVLREHVDPGYLHKAITNDLGRFVSTIDGHAGGRLWYFGQLPTFPWLIPGLLIAGYRSWRGREEERVLARFLRLLSSFYLVVIAAAQTKLSWYAMPVYPLIAMLVAVGACDAMEGIAAHSSLSPSLRRNLCVGGCLLVGSAVILSNIMQIGAAIRRNARSLPDSYNIFLRSQVLRDSDVGAFTVVHPGVGGIFPEPSGYVAPTLFYVNLLRQGGRSISITRNLEALPQGSAHVLACGTVARALTEPYTTTPVAAEAGCGLYSFAARP